MSRNKKNLIQNMIMILLIAIALVPVFSIAVPFLQESVHFAVQLMLGYLFLGFGFLIIGKKRLLLTSFACCGLLCLFLKQSSNEHLVFPQVTQQDKITVAHFNTSSATNGYASLLEAVIASNPDIASFQEVTPDWHNYLNDSLTKLYPYNAGNVRIDPYGMEIFSKLPIEKYDTFHYEEIPHQMVTVSVSENKQLNVISAHVLPPLGKRLNQRAKMHLNTISDQVASSTNPSIVLGDFNLVYWSNEIINFRQAARLENSRRDISQNLLNVPYDHIFFSDKLECTSFGEVLDSSSAHLGIMGTYQVKTAVDLKQASAPSLFKD